MIRVTGRRSVVERLYTNETICGDKTLFIDQVGGIDRGFEGNIAANLYEGVAYRASCGSTGSIIWDGSFISGTRRTAENVLCLLVERLYSP